MWAREAGPEQNSLRDFSVELLFSSLKPCVLSPLRGHLSSGSQGADINAKGGEGARRMSK